MSVTLVQLATFARVAALENYTRAAVELHLTQPAVTQQIHAIERQFGVRLVDVVGRRLALTDAGRFLAARAAGVLADMALLEREMEEFAAAHAGFLEVGATLTIGAYALPALLAAFRERHPGIDVRVRVANTAQMVEWVRAGMLRIALVEGPLAAEDVDALAITPFQEDRLVLVAPRNDPLIGRVPVDPEALRDAVFISREVGSGTRALAESALARVGVVPRIVLEMPSGEGVARAVEAGVGVAILSELVVARAVAEGRLATADIAGVDLTRAFRLIQLRDRTLSPAATAFVALLRNVSATRSDGTGASNSAY